MTWLNITPADAVLSPVPDVMIGILLIVIILLVGFLIAAIIILVRKKKKKNRMDPVYPQVNDHDASYGTPPTNPPYQNK